MRKDGKISEDIIHLFYEMNLQKCEEYFGGELIGSDENRELDTVEPQFFELPRDRQSSLKNRGFEKSKCSLTSIFQTSTK